MIEKVLDTHQRVIEEGYTAKGRKGYRIPGVAGLPGHPEVRFHRSCQHHLAYRGVLQRLI